MKHISRTLIVGMAVGTKGMDPRIPHVRHAANPPGLTGPHPFGHLADPAMVRNILSPHAPLPLVHPHLPGPMPGMVMNPPMQPQPVQVIPAGPPFAGSPVMPLQNLRPVHGAPIPHVIQPGHPASPLPRVLPQDDTRPATVVPIERSPMRIDEKTTQSLSIAQNKRMIEEQQKKVLENSNIIMAQEQRMNQNRMERQELARELGAVNAQIGAKRLELESVSTEINRAEQVLKLEATVEALRTSEAALAAELRGLEHVRQINEEFRQQIVALRGENQRLNEAVAIGEASLLKQVQALEAENKELRERYPPIKETADQAIQAEGFLPKRPMSDAQSSAGPTTAGSPRLSIVSATSGSTTQPAAKPNEGCFGQFQSWFGAAPSQIAGTAPAGANSDRGSFASAHSDRGSLASFHSDRVASGQSSCSVAPEFPANQFGRPPIETEKPQGMPPASGSPKDSVPARSIKSSESGAPVGSAKSVNEWSPENDAWKVLGTQDGRSSTKELEREVAEKGDALAKAAEKAKVENQQAGGLSFLPQLF